MSDPTDPNDPVARARRSTEFFGPRVPGQLGCVAAKNLNVPAGKRLQRIPTAFEGHHAQGLVADPGRTRQQGRLHPILAADRAPGCKGHGRAIALHRIEQLAQGAPGRVAMHGHHAMIECHCSHPADAFRAPGSEPTLGDVQQSAAGERDQFARFGTRPANHLAVGQRADAARLVHDARRGGLGAQHGPHQLAGQVEAATGFGGRHALRHVGARGRQRRHQRRADEMTTLHPGPHSMHARRPRPPSPAPNTSRPPWRWATARAMARPRPDPRLPRPFAKRSPALD